MSDKIVVMYVPVSRSGKLGLFAPVWSLKECLCEDCKKKIPKEA